MSKIYVDEIAGIASPSTVAIPGHVIQVVSVQNANSSSIATTSTSYVSSGISLNITPTSTSSDVFLDFRSYMMHGDRVRITIYRNGTELSGIGQYTFGFHATTTTYESGTILWKDSPSTTSSVAYEIYFASHTGNNAQLVHNTSGYTFTAQEIAK